MIDDTLFVAFVLVGIVSAAAVLVSISRVRCSSCKSGHVNCVCFWTSGKLSRCRHCGLIWSTPPEEKL
jgi:hypothetical protein